MKELKRIICLAVFSFIFISSGSAQDKLRVFVIGNSFSNNATTYLSQIAKDRGVNLEFKKAELGGCSLERHWSIVEAYEADHNDPQGKQYGGKSLKMMLSEGKWDIVTIQQYSLLSGDVNTYRPYAKKLYDYVKSIQPDAKIVVHQTWAYRSDARGFGKINGEIRAKSDDEMWGKSRAAYHTIASELNNASIIPSGDAFWDVTKDPKWTFRRDSSINKSKFVYPQVVNEPLSLHVGYKWDKEKDLATDYNHASVAGCYLGGLVWYGFLFDASPKKVKFKPEGVSEKFAKRLRSAAKTALAQSDIGPLGKNK